MLFPIFINWWVYPLLEKLLARVPNDIMNIAFAFILMFNTIIWSLYIIVPPWISNENKTPQELAQLAQEQDLQAIQDERGKLSTYVVLLGSSSESLAESVRENRGITDAERESMLAEIDEINGRISAIEKIVNSDLPDELIPSVQTPEASSA